MSTRSHIGIKDGPGTVTAIYCHWDGYPSNNGKILLQHYSDIDKVYNLIELGDMSCLEPTLSSCVFYGRDKGETNVGCQTFDNVESFLAKCKEDYTYLYDVEEDQWFFRSWGGELRPLTLEDCNDAS